MLIIPHQASASHFRFGLVTTTRLSETPTTVTYRLNVSVSWRLGTAPVYIPFTISGGNTGSVTVTMTTVTDPTGTYDNSWGTANVTLNKTSTLTKFENVGFSKLGTISNNANANWDIYTIINTNAPGSSPVSSLPAIINMPAGVSANTFSLPYSDPDAGTTFTFGAPSFTGGLAGESEPSGFSIDAATGLMTFNTTGKLPGEMYNAMVTITDNDNNQVELDFLLNMVSTSAPPQFDYSVTPLNGFVYNILVGQNITFPVKATNPGSGTTVDLSVSGMPPYITTSNFSPAFPATGNPSVTNFSWTPASPQLGSTVILNFIATNNYGIQAYSYVTINVVSEPAPVYISPTPGERTIRSVLAGLPHYDTITAQSSIGSNVSVATASLPSGSATSPAIPTAGTNPGRTIFSWTPASSDFGQHHLTYDADISAIPTINSTLHYDLIVDDLPVFSSTPVTTATGCVAYTYSVSATDANIPYGDTVDIVSDGTLPSWLTLTPTGNGTAVLSGTPANADAGSYVIVLGAEDLYHHNYNPVQQTFTIVVTGNVITGSPVVCIGSSTMLSDAITGGTWSCSNTNISINPATGLVTGVAGGASIITFTPVAGCLATMSMTINTLPSVTSGTTNVSCYGLSNGSITTSVSGGTTPYTYLWNTGATTSGLTGKSAGPFTVTVTDAHGCTANGSYTITQPVVLSLASASSVNVSCNGANNGSITTNVTGGTLPYNYKWSTGSTGANLTGLAPCT